MRTLVVGSLRQPDCHTDLSGQKRQRRRAEDKRPRAINQELLQGFRARHKSTRSSQRLAASVNRCEQAWMTAGPSSEAAPLGSEHARGMCFIDDQGRPVAIRHFGQVMQGSAIALHAEYTLKHNELFACIVLTLAQG